MPQKKCVNTFSTKTGKFTAHRAKFSRCEAEALCRANGQELASFTNKEDMQAAIDMFNGNNCRLDPNDPENYQYDNCDSQPELENCPYSSDDFTVYYNIGLNVVKQADGSFKKSFSNGMPWNEAEHSKLYYRNPEQKWQCPFGAFRPDTQEEEYVFTIGEKSDNCDYENLISYICLDPAKRNPASLVMPPTKSRGFQVGTFMLVGMCALVAFVSAFVVAVFYRKKKNREMEEKMEAASYEA